MTRSEFIQRCALSVLSQSDTGREWILDHQELQRLADDVAKIAPFDVDDAGGKVVRLVFELLSLAASHAEDIPDHLAEWLKSKAAAGSVAQP